MDYYILSPLLFILRVLEACSQFSLVLAISNIKIDFKRFLIASFVHALLFEIAKVYTPQYLSSLIATILAVSTIVFILKINFKKAIFSYLITIMTLAIVDFLVSLSILKICNLDTFIELSQTEILMILGRIAIAGTMFLISYVIKTLRNREKNNKTENIKNSMSLVTITITFFLLLPNIMMIIYYNDSKTLPQTFILINIIAIIVMFFINIYNTQRGIKLIQAEEELISEKTYNKTLKDLVDGLRAFKHDYNNTLQTMYGLIFTENYTELKSFFEQILDESRAITALDKLNPELFRNPVLLGLVTAKFEYARKSGVTMNFEIYADLENLDMKSYDFTRILGIFLDNAIEAAAGSEKKIVNFYVVEKNGKITIELSNSFSDTGLKLEDINKKGISSKGENRGLGLYKVKDILKRYPETEHTTKAQNGMFLQKLVIDKVKQMV